MSIPNKKVKRATHDNLIPLHVAKRNAPNLYRLCHGNAILSQKKRMLPQFLRGLQNIRFATYGNTCLSPEIEYNNPCLSIMKVSFEVS
jgi:hypothetical protein